MSHCGHTNCGLDYCKHDHRPARLYPGYDNSGWPMLLEQRCADAASRLYSAIMDAPHDEPFAIKQRIKEALMELFR